MRKGLRGDYVYEITDEDLVAWAAYPFIMWGMGKVIGYMVTWTTYGTWLQGEEKGFES